jgi:hypothetical protein
MECPDCTHRISATALLCPVCGWTAPIEEVAPDSGSKTERIGKAAGWLTGAVVVAALGPAAIAGAAGALLVPSGVNIKECSGSDHVKRILFGAFVCPGRIAASRVCHRFSHVFCSPSARARIGILLD